MGSRQDTKACVAAAFPGREALIERAYRESSSFRDLCSDYRNCAAALERWRGSESDAAPQRAREYAELLRQLGGEIESWIEAVESVPGSPSRSGPQ